MSLAHTVDAGSEAAWADRQSTLCIIKFESAQGSSDSESATTVQGRGRSLGLCGAQQEAAGGDAPQELLRRAREAASLGGRAEWILCNRSEDAEKGSGASLTAGVLLHGNDPAVLDELMSAARELRPLCGFLGDDARVELLDAEPYGLGLHEQFEQCSRLFTAGTAADVQAARFKRLPAAAAVSFFERGYCVVDDFLDAATSAGIPEAVRPSLDAWLEAADLESEPPAHCFAFASGAAFQRPVRQALGLETDMEWRRPQPWRVRGDYIASLSASDRLAKRAPMKTLLDAMQDLLDDLRTFVDLRGRAWGDQEVQLAWYPAGSVGYGRHLDAPAKGFGAGRAGRRITAILYCNEAWLPEHGGELQLWAPNDKRRVDVEPRAGRLLLFLSGCVPHAVRPAQRARVAVTMWAR